MIANWTMEQARKQAEMEIEKEKFDERVIIEKEKIRAKQNKSFWSKVFPWKLTIERR